MYKREWKWEWNTMTVFNLDVHWRRAFIMWKKLYNFGFGVRLFVFVVNTFHKGLFRARCLFISYLFWGCCVFVVSFLIMCCSAHGFGIPTSCVVLYVFLKMFFSFFDSVQIFFFFVCVFRNFYLIVRSEILGTNKLYVLCECVMSCVIRHFWMCSNFPKRGDALFGYFGAPKILSTFQKFFFDNFWQKNGEKRLLKLSWIYWRKKKQKKKKRKSPNFVGLFKVGGSKNGKGPRRQKFTKITSNTRKNRFGQRNLLSCFFLRLFGKQILMFCKWDNHPERTFVWLSSIELSW